VAAFIQGSRGNRFLFLKHLLSSKVTITLGSFLAAGKEYIPQKSNCHLNEQQTRKYKSFWIPFLVLLHSNYKCKPLLN